MQPRVPVASSAARRLREDHEDLNARCVELRGHASDAAEVRAVWDEFVRDLDAHMAFEEHDVFPPFERDADDGTVVVHLLLRQHALIRRRIEALSDEVRRGTVGREAIDTFLDALERHTRLEDVRVYAWLEEHELIA